MKYRTKPFEIDAILFDGNNWSEVRNFVGQREVDEDYWICNFQAAGSYVAWDDDSIVAEVYDKLHHTWVGVKTGQHIIKGMKGEFYPCDPEVFETKYEPVYATGGRLEKPMFMSPNRELIIYADGRIECARVKLTDDYKE